MIFSLKKRLSSSCRMYTTLERELQNESAERNFPLLRYLRREENRACTSENLSFIEAKRWVVENHDFLTKIDHQKQQSTTIKKCYKKTLFFLTFFASGPSKNGAPVETGWRFLKMTMKNECFLDISFDHVFSSKNQVFQHVSTRVMIRKPCFLQWFLMIFVL